MEEFDQMQFITEYHFSGDASKPGRILEMVKVGGVHVSHLAVEPHVITGNLYRKETNTILFVTKGKIQFSFVQIHTGERRDMILEPDTAIIHWPPFVACASKNLSDEVSEVYFFSNKAFRSGDDYPYEVISA